MGNHNVLIALSGGLDSATLLARYIDLGYSCSTVSFYYGSKHNLHEYAMAQRLAAYYGVSNKLVDISKALEAFKSNLLQSGGDIPEGHYEDSTMKLTVVPCRNMIFASILAGLADSLDISTVALGVHAGDHAIYPDCRPAFVASLWHTLMYATDNRVHVEAPFLHETKAQVVARGLKLGVPYNFTRTCYKAQEEACGLCGSCQERLEAFKLNNAKDPIVYA